jgi:hypothetical protein
MPSKRCRKSENTMRKMRRGLADMRISEMLKSEMREIEASRERKKNLSREKTSFRLSLGNLCRSSRECHFIPEFFKTIVDGRLLNKIFQRIWRSDGDNEVLNSVEDQVRITLLLFFRKQYFCMGLSDAYLLIRDLTSKMGVCRMTLTFLAFYHFLKAGLAKKVGDAIVKSLGHTIRLWRVWIRSLTLRNNFEMHPSSIVQVGKLHEVLQLLESESKKALLEVEKERFSMDQGALYKRKRRKANWKVEFICEMVKWHIIWDLRLRHLIYFPKSHNGRMIESIQGARYQDNMNLILSQRVKDESDLGEQDKVHTEKAILLEKNQKNQKNRRELAEKEGELKTRKESLIEAFDEDGSESFEKSVMLRRWADDEFGMYY